MDETADGGTRVSIRTGGRPNELLDVFCARRKSLSVKLGTKREQGKTHCRKSDLGYGITDTQRI